MYNDNQNYYLYEYYISKYPFCFIRVVSRFRCRKKKELVTIIVVVHTITIFSLSDISEH